MSKKAIVHSYDKTQFDFLKKSFKGHEISQYIQLKYEPYNQNKVQLADIYLVMMSQQDAMEMIKNILGVE